MPRRHRRALAFKIVSARSRSEPSLIFARILIPAGLRLTSPIRKTGAQTGAPRRCYDVMGGVWAFAGAVLAGRWIVADCEPGK